MSGHLGDVTRTVQLLEVARVDAERSLIMECNQQPRPADGPHRGRRRKTDPRLPGRPRVKLEREK